MIAFALQVLGVVFLIWLALLSVFVLREFVIGPALWRRRFARDAERLAELGRERLP